MGCHTWVYKKFKYCDNTHKKNFLEQCNKSIEYDFEPYEQFAKEMKEIVKDYMEYYQPDSKEYKDWEEYGKEENLKKRYKQRTRKFKPFKENGVTEDNVLKYCKLKGIDAEYKIVKGELYLNVHFNYPFRVYGYPEDSFTNKDKLLKWLYKKDPHFYGYYDEVTYEFVEGYTDKLIERINKYFEDNGEDNLYIEFG